MDSLQATPKEVTFTYEGQELKPQTTPEWVASILQRAGMTLVTCVDRMCELSMKDSSGLTISIDVSISDSNRIAAIYPTAESWTRSLVSEHVEYEKCAVINIKRVQTVTLMMPIEFVDAKVNARHVIVAICEHLANCPRGLRTVPEQEIATGLRAQKLLAELFMVPEDEET